MRRGTGPAPVASGARFPPARVPHFPLGRCNSRVNYGPLSVPTAKLQEPGVAVVVRRGFGSGRRAQAFPSSLIITTARKLSPALGWPVRIGQGRALRIEDSARLLLVRVAEGSLFFLLA